MDELSRVLLLLGRVLLLLAIDALSKGRRGEEKEEDDRWGHVLVTGERGWDEVYVFVYACSWVQDVSIRIMWHICGKRRIVIACFKIGE